MRPAVRLFVGETTHHRFKPRPHRFTYKLFQIEVDLDQLKPKCLGRRSQPIGPLGLFAFASRDHGARDGSPLRPWIEACLNKAGVSASAANIQLLCFPRVLGFVFNPISAFFVRDAAGGLEAVVYEVNNTFGQTHAYVIPAGGGAVERHEADKQLYVSPFYRVEGGYQFRLERTEATVDLTIVKQVAGRPDFNARLSLEQRSLTDAALLTLFFTMPLMTLGVTAAIHWQALKLWLKGAPFGARPPGPKSGVSLGRITARTASGATTKTAPTKILETLSL